MKISKEEHVTFNKYWNYVLPIEKKNLIFNILRKIKHSIENFFNIKIIIKKKFEEGNERNSLVISKNLNKLKIIQLEIILKKFLKDLHIKPNINIKKIIIQHDKIFFDNCPVKDNSGGIGYNSSLFLYSFFNSIKPDLIIESGVWKGYTSYLIDQKFRKNFQIKFDINFSKLMYKSKTAKYIERDISLFKFNKKELNCKNKLFFFDDHISQYDRFLLSDKLDAKYIVFDDDICHSSIHSDGWPSYPTIKMCLEKIDYGIFKWKTLGKVAKGKQMKFDFAKFVKKINKYYYVRTQNISDITGYYQQPCMSFLIKKRSKIYR